MARLPFNIGKMLSVPNLRRQFLQAVEDLTKELPLPDALGHAYKICEVWQRRLELALRSEIPDWVGLAAFRPTLDFKPSPDVLADLTGRGPTGETSPRNCALTTLDECQQAYRHYIELGQDFCSGKLILQGEAAQDWFLGRAQHCEAVLGGQAGNIAWLWRCLGADTRLYTPYWSSRLAHLPTSQPGVERIQLLLLNNGTGEFRPCLDLPANDHAPTAGGLTIVKDGRRMIYMLPGFRSLDQSDMGTTPWEQVQFFYQDQELLERPLQRAAGDLTWPSLPLFCEWRINPELKRLEIMLTDETTILSATQGQVDFAVLGGMDAIYYDPWLRQERQLQARLLNILEKQLKALAAGGTRIGVELSGFPRREYALLIQRLCREAVIVALGINGVDELPRVVGSEILEKELHEFWLDPLTVDTDLRGEVSSPQCDEHFEYITYLRARKLAQETGVRTLYVHTLTLDFTLRRDADPGALLRAQLGDLMGKGLVIAALLQRSYGDNWLDELKRMPPAVNPRAMAKLGRFARDFEQYEKVLGSGERLLMSGYWLSPSHDGYSVAVVPIVWPPVAEGEVSPQLPALMNPTGSGDMAFGAFFFLGGV